MRKNWSKVPIALLMIGSSGILVTAFMGLGRVAGAEPVFTILPSPAKNVSGISFDGAALWLTIDGAQTIFQVEPKKWQIKREVKFPIKATGGSAWDGASLWQLAYEEKKIFQWNPETERILGEIPTPGRGMCSGVTFDGKYLWVANFEDKRFYQVDQTNGGRILQTQDGYFEATGLAWDGKYLWSGLLVGTVELGEATPYTGFVIQRNPASREILSVFHLPGVGAGCSNWTPSTRERTKLFWWYDGFNNRIVQVRLPFNPVSKLQYMISALGWPAFQF